MDYAPKEKLLLNPKENANFLSRLLFVWTLPLFYKGTKKTIEINDLFNTFSEDKSNLLGDTLERHYNAEVKRKNLHSQSKSSKSTKKESGSLLKALCKTLWVDITYIGIIGFLNEIIFKIATPILLGKLLNYFKPNSEVSYTDALWYAGGVVFFSGATALAMNHYMLGGFLLGMKARIAVCSLIYRKSLRLSHSALSESAPGKVVNLLSNDVNRFDICGMFFHYLWMAPLSSIIILYLIWVEIGFSGIFGVLIVFTTMPIQAYTGKLSAKFRLQTALKTDERVRFMGEIVSGIQVIKMYVWEKPFQKLITWARRLEIKPIKKNSYVRAMFMTFLISTTRIGMFFVLLSMTLFEYDITVDRLFVVASFFSVLSGTLSSLFVRAIAEVSETIVAIKRLEKYLNHSEFSNDSNISPQNGKELKTFNDPKSKPVRLLLNDVKARWDDAETTPTFHIKDISVIDGQLIGIIGPVGSGKSSLLQIILKELQILQGELNINGTISYAGQEPWVFGGSVRQNILFGQQFNKKRYNEVIKVCALERDFEQFTHGDKSLVGERGVSLSGGQKARINLARAIYRQADIYLLDDPLSAVDTHVGRHLFDKCILEYLKGKTRILVTHQLHYLKSADHIVLLQDGKVELINTYEGFCNSTISYAQLMISEEESDTEEDIASLKNTGVSLLSQNKSSLRNRERKNSNISSHRIRTESMSSSLIDTDDIGNHDFNCDEIEKKEREQSPKLLAEASSKSAVKGSKMMIYFRSGTGIGYLLLIALTFIISQFMVSAADFWMAYWTAQEELRGFYNTRLNFTNITGEEMLNFQKESDNILSTYTCMTVHGCIVAFLLIVSMWRAFEFYNACMRSSQILHDEMFQGVIRAPMSFFNTNPSGRILNRFSKDIGNMDEWFPKAILDASQAILTIIGAVCLTCSVNPMFIIPTVIIGFLFLLLRHYYLKTSKDLKRLEGIYRSPVFTHLSATLQGLSTIRAFAQQKVLKSEFDGYQDVHTAAWSLFIITSSAFGLLLDMMCTGLVCVVTFSFLLINSNVMGDQVGLAITQVMSLSLILQWGIRQSAEVANQLMAVERILEYTLIPSEDGTDIDTEITEVRKKLHASQLQLTNNLKKPPPEWPEYGKIQFKNLFLKYSEDPMDSYVLKGLNCVFQPTEKIGIVGRTGAGKSSLIAALFRLAYNEGSVIIDGIETHTISLENLRRKISIIPQDPVLFSGTLRRNLDPFEEYSDQDIWDALEKVELKETLSGPAGLEMKVLDEGSNFSVGQRQLVCLARAILRNNRILMLDEATANVDPHTDNLIQMTIRSKFCNCTVLTIAHRLNTIMDSDRVLVMDKGQIVEFDAPYLLLQNNDGVLYKMAQETGKQNADALLSAAKEHYDSVLSKRITSYDDFKMIDD